MHLHHSRKFEISLFNSEVDTFRVLLEMAHTYLCSQPEHQLHGTPLKRQAGLVGPELTNLKEMLQQMGMSVNADIFTQPSPASFPLATITNGATQ